MIDTDCRGRCKSNYRGPSWSWSYDSWIYNYLYNQSLSTLKLWVRIPLMERCTWYNIMWWSLWFTPGTPVSSTNNWPPLCNWNIVESGVKQHNPHHSHDNMNLTLLADLISKHKEINSCAKSAWYARRQHSYNICKDSFP